MHKLTCTYHQHLELSIAISIFPKELTVDWRPNVPPGFIEDALKINFLCAPHAMGPYDPEATSTAVLLPQISTTKSQSISCESLGNHSSAMLSIE